MSIADQVHQYQVAHLPHLSLVDVGGVRLLFFVNHGAVRQALAHAAGFQS